jgi:hypothetical protein
MKLLIVATAALVVLPQVSCFVAPTGALKACTAVKRSRCSMSSVEEDEVRLISHLVRIHALC